MTGNTQHIIRQLFQAGSLDSVSVEQLENLVQLYPAFGAGHYLLAKKLQRERHDDFDQQARKTALYFTNPLWLHWLLQDKKENSSPLPALAVTPEAAVQEPDPSVTENNTNNKEEETEQKDLENTIGKTVAMQAAQASELVKETAVTFEPYHTIDYFASLGIKFIQEINPNDKLGKQLKSFTEWLKVMKKLPQKNIDEPVDDAVTANIEIDAARSITEKEVVTEAMADVLAKQGKTDKAVEVYHKLSLLYPDKSAYFATRIEQLKVH